jgi:hypothetical protein
VGHQKPAGEALIKRMGTVAGGGLGDLNMRRLRICLRVYRGDSSRIASQLRSEPHLAIIKLMTWEEFQDLHLEAAREVGAERCLRVRLAVPEDLHDPACDYTPAMLPRWGYFRRRTKLREIGVVFYKLDDQTQPYFIMGNYMRLSELDKLDASAYRRGIAEALRNGLDEAEKRRGRGFGFE